MDENAQGGPPPARKRMVFTKRDPEAAARLEAERQAATKSNPFGDAKPREKVIAQRTGKEEKDVLVEDSMEYRFKLRLNNEQKAEKGVIDDEVRAIKEKIEEEEDETRKAELQAELEAKQADVKEMMAKFEQMIVAEARQGTGMRPSERRAAAAAREAAGEGGDRNEQFGQGYGSSRQPGGRRDDRDNRGGDKGYYDKQDDGYAKSYQARSDMSEPKAGGSKGFPGYQARPIGDRPDGGDRRGGFGGDKGGGGFGGGDKGGGAFGGDRGGYKSGYQGADDTFGGDYPMGADGEDYRSPYV